MRSALLSAKLPVKILLLVLVSALIAFSLNLVSPHRIAWRGEWGRYVEAKALEAGIALADLSQAVAIVDAQTHMVIDARHTVDFNAGHIPGPCRYRMTRKLSTSKTSSCC